MLSSTPRYTRSRSSGGIGPDRPAIARTASSRSLPLIASPFTRATTSGSCAGTGFVVGAAAGAWGVAAGAGGADCAEAAGAGAACGVAFAGVVREQAASVAMMTIEIARRTFTPYVVQSTVVWRRWSDATDGEVRGRRWKLNASLIPVEFALTTDQPVFAHARKRGLARVTADQSHECDQRRATQQWLEHANGRVSPQRELFDACGHAASPVTTTVPTKTCVLYSAFCHRRASARPSARQFR